MNETLKRKLETLPQKSGVYIMKDKNDEIIYVGKAKILRNRVRSYFNREHKDSYKVSIMVENISDFDYILCPTEYDALVLENNLIKKHKPFYNILLKDSKTFPYIRINKKDKYPELRIVRKVEKDGADYFGPFLGGINAYDLVRLTNRIYGLKNCSRKFAYKKNERPCLNYDLGLCTAPCGMKITQTDYRELLNKAIRFLLGEDREIIHSLTLQMKQASASMNFEKAMQLKNDIELVRNFNLNITTELTRPLDADIFVVNNDGTNSMIAIGTVRRGKLLGVDTHSLDFFETESLDYIIIDYYETHVLPKEIYTNTNLSTDLSSYLATKHNKAIKISKPNRGAKYRMVALVEQNALNHIIKNSSKKSLQMRKTMGAVANLQSELNLTSLPRRIECYDISHISGTYTVGSMVVFIDGESATSHYRRFRIKTVEGNDDFASMKEVLNRRLLKLCDTQEIDESFGSIPDLIVIDGGKGQLGKVEELLEEMPQYIKDKINLISLAKRFEEVYIPNSSTPIVIPHERLSIQLLIRIRNEAHRFAITYHRTLRGKGMVADILDSIAGIGNVRKKAISKKYPSLKELENAKIEDLASIKGITVQIAKDLFTSLH